MRLLEIPRALKALEHPAVAEAAVVPSPHRLHLREVARVAGEATDRGEQFLWRDYK